MRSLFFRKAQGCAIACLLSLGMGVPFAHGAGTELPSAALSFDAAIALALQHTPQLAAARSKLEASRLAAISAGELPDPKLALGIENFPVGGPDRYSLTRDFMTMQRIAVMQEFPDRHKRDARLAIDSLTRGAARNTATWSACS